MIIIIDYYCYYFFFLNIETWEVLLRFRQSLQKPATIVRSLFCQTKRDSKMHVYILLQSANGFLHNNFLLPGYIVVMHKKIFCGGKGVGSSELNNNHSQLQNRDSDVVA